MLWGSKSSNVFTKRNYHEHSAKNILSSIGKFYFGSTEPHIQHSTPTLMTSTSAPDDLNTTPSLKTANQHFLYSTLSSQPCESATVSPNQANISNESKRTALKHTSLWFNVRHAYPKSPSPGEIISDTSAPNAEENPTPFLPYSTTVDINDDSPLEPTWFLGFWHWLVVLGSFVCLFVVEGVCFSYGLYMYAVIVEEQFSRIYDDGELGSSLATLSFPGAIMYGTNFLIGPLAGALVNRFNDRLIAGLGALISTVSILLSGLCARELPYFTLLFGFFGGIGCGLIYLPAITVVGQWFERRRALIVGVAMCGGGFGAGLLAIAIWPLCRAFTWRGTLVITSALFAQTLLGIALFRPFCTHQSTLAAHRDHLRVNAMRHKSENTNLDNNKKSFFFRKPSSRRSGLKRGSIMTKIIEEKNRQRTTSTGSLDGMVITRENEVIALSSSEAYESVAAAAAIYAATHSVQDCEHTATLTSCTEKRTDEQTENKIRCTHIAGFSGRSALQTLQEEPCTSFSSNQHSCTAVIPPPVRFGRHAVLRIAKAIIHKLQTAKVLPQNVSSIIDARRSRYVMPNFRFSDGGRIGPYSNVETSQNPLSMSGQKTRPHNLIEIGGQPSRNHIFGRKTSVNLPLRLNTSVGSRCSAHNMPSGASSSPRLSGADSPPTSSRLASSVSLDPFINGLIVGELRGLPLDDQTKASILSALQFELTPPKRRADLFYHGVRKPDLEGSTRLSSRADDAFGSGCNIFYVTYKTGFGSIRRVPRRYPGYNEPSNNRTTESASLSKQTVIRWEATPHITHEAGINFEPYDNMADVRSYLFYMLDVNILRSITFLVLLLACSINMLALLVPYYYLPLLLELGGFECSVNKQWCPNGLPHHENLQPNWLYHLTRWIAGDDSATFFVSPGSVLLTMGLANVVGRILAALYMEGDESARYQLFRRCRLVKDPVLLNIFSLLLCGLSLAFFPLSIHGLVASTPPQDDNQPKHVQAWSTEFRLVLLYFSSSMYGVASAIALSLRSVILVELFGIRRLTNAFGYLLIFQGLSVVCGPPLFGYFCDPACHGQLVSGSYSEVPSDLKSSHSFECVNRLCTAFYICAALFLLTGLLFTPLRWLANRESVACCCPSASGAAVSSSHSPKESSWTENTSPCFSPFHPDFSAGDNQETQTTVLDGRTDSGN